MMNYKSEVIVMRKRFDDEDILIGNKHRRR